MPYDSSLAGDWFGKASMQKISVLSIQRIGAEDRAKIAAVDPAIQLIDAGGWYDGEIRETWPAFTSARYLVPGATGSGTREERGGGNPRLTMLGPYCFDAANDARWAAIGGPKARSISSALCTPSGATFMFNATEAVSATRRNPAWADVSGCRTATRSGSGRDRSQPRPSR